MEKIYCKYRYLLLAALLCLSIGINAQNEDITISDISLIPSAQATYAGGPEVTVTLGYSTNAEIVEGYAEQIEWSEDGVNWTKGVKDYTFNPKGLSGTATIHARVSIVGPDGSVWREESQSVDVDICKKPDFASFLQDNHQYKNNEGNRNYSTYKGVTFDITQLYNEEYKSTGFSKGWEMTFLVDGVEQPNMIYIPSEPGKHQLTLLVKNGIPNNNWLEEEYNYTLRVYDSVTVKNNLKELFKDVSNLDLHVENNDQVSFSFQVAGGEPNNWESHIVIDSKQEEFQKINSTLFYNFKKSNISGTEDVYNFKIEISNNIPDLVRGQESFRETISGTIHVWNEITATVSLYGLDNLKFDTRIGDADPLKIQFNSNGGDPQKWELTLSDEGNNSLNGELYKKEDEDFYTYVIDNSNLIEGEYNCKLTAIYNDGQTQKRITKDENNISINVWPKPEINALELALVNKDVRYISSTEDEIVVYEINCFEGDELMLSFKPIGGQDNGTWKYRTGTGAKEILQDNQIPIDENTATVQFYNYLSNDTKERLVESVRVVINRFSKPAINTVLPNIDNTQKNDWDAASENNPVDLYGGMLADGTRHEAKFNFSPLSESIGYKQGWEYIWKVNENTEDIENNGIWIYTAETSSNIGNNRYEDKKITVSIKNSIPAGKSQKGENVGFDTTKTYYVRVWREAELPKSYCLKDENNEGNDVYITHAIREGNILAANVEPIKYGYHPNSSNISSYEYNWSGQGAVSGKTEWKTIVENSDYSKNPGSSNTTYKLVVSNIGPRGTIWARKELESMPVTIYNHPEAPKSLVIKGQGAQAGTSGTLIITFDGINDQELLKRKDYVLIFGYEDEIGNNRVIAKEIEQNEEGNLRYTTGYNKNTMKNAYAYTYWWEGNNLITSGKKSLNPDNSEEIRFDKSKYDISEDEKNMIKAMTRAGNGDYTAVPDIAFDNAPVGNISVYNMSGVMVGTSTRDLAPGMYIIQYQQNGTMKSKKLSVK